MRGFKALREHSGITWIERERSWVATPDDVVTVLSKEGFEECKRETTTSRRDGHPAGGIWQGVDHRTGSVASAVWVSQAAWPHALVFIEVDGDSGPGVQVETVGQPAHLAGEDLPRERLGTELCRIAFVHQGRVPFRDRHAEA